MSWWSDFLSGKFSRAARKEAEQKALDPVQIQLIRHKLQVWMKSPAGDDEPYVRAELFLNKLKSLADNSPLRNILNTTPAGTKAGAGIALMQTVAAGKLPFFYEPREKQPVYVDDISVPVTYFAEHALTLLEQTKSVYLAGLYEQALEASRTDIKTKHSLMNDKGQVYIDKNKEGWSFTFGMANPLKAKPGYQALEIVMRHKL